LIFIDSMGVLGEHTGQGPKVVEDMEPDLLKTNKHFRVKYVLVS